jgi:hypothetical protein
VSDGEAAAGPDQGTDYGASDSASIDSARLVRAARNGRDAEQQPGCYANSRESTCLSFHRIDSH